MSTFVYVSTLPWLQILDQDDQPVVDFLNVTPAKAQRMAFNMNLSRWSVKEPKYVGQ